MGVRWYDVRNVSLIIDGTLEASVHNEQWPVDKHHSVFQMLYFEDCYNITIGGKGLIDGLGYDWWIREWKVQNPNSRFNLIEARMSRGIEIYGLELRNAPHSFIKVKDVDQVNIHDMAIETQLFKQRGSMIRGVDEPLSLPESASSFE